MSRNRLAANENQREFGRDTQARDNLEAHMVGQALRRRQSAKIRNFERIATRLEMRGEKDAAIVLNRAAGRLRTILREPA